MRDSSPQRLYPVRLPPHVGPDGVHAVVELVDLLVRDAVLHDGVGGFGLQDVQQAAGRVVASAGHLLLEDGALLEQYPPPALRAALVAEGRLLAEGHGEGFVREGVGAGGFLGD